MLAAQRYDSHHRRQISHMLTSVKCRNSDPETLIFPPGSWTKLCKSWMVGKAFDGFMHLPLEIRNHIYELLLVKTKVFVPNALHTLITDAYGNRGEDRSDLSGEHYGHGANGPWYSGIAANKFAAFTPGLLEGVSKAVDLEATRVSWGHHNQIIFPAGPWIYPLSFSQGSHVRRGQNDPCRIVRDLSFAFDLRDGDSKMDESEW